MTRVLFILTALVLSTSRVGADENQPPAPECSRDAEWTNHDSDDYAVYRTGLIRDGVESELWEIFANGRFDEGCEMATTENKSKDSVTFDRINCNYEFNSSTFFGFGPAELKITSLDGRGEPSLLNTRTGRIRPIESLNLLESCKDGRQSESDLPFQNRELYF